LERGERVILSFLSLPPFIFYSTKPPLILVPVADGGLDFSISSLLFFSGSSSVFGRNRRIKTVTECVLGLPGVMARMWIVGSEQEAPSSGSGSVSLLEGPTEWLSVAAFASLVAASSVSPCLLFRLLLSFRAVALLCPYSIRWVFSPLPPADGSFLFLRFSSFRSHCPLPLLMFCNWLPFVLCSRDGTGVQPYKPPLPSASTPPAFHLLVPPHRFGFSGVQLARLEWTSLVRNGRTRTCRPCFACSTVGVALGTVCGPSDCSPAVTSLDSCGFDAGPGINLFAVVCC
ncbi:LOW QUALITY PROTEIN: hypothetical protein HID58_007222, partial [Brassica napus]